MIQLLKKYALAFYAIISLSMVYALSPLTSFNNSLNIVLVAFGLFLGLGFARVVFSKASLYTFSILWVYLLINLLYQLSFGWLIFRWEDVLYLLAKASFTFIVVTSIITHTDFYFKNFYSYIGVLILILIVLGFIFSQRTSGGRLYLGFANPNEAGALAAIGFGIFLLHPKFNNAVKWIGVIFLLIAVILTGSRAALVISMLSGIFYLRFNLKSIVASLMILMVVFLLMPKMGFNVVGLDRLIETFDSEDGVLATNRKSEFEVGLLMFKNKFWTGYGLTGYKIIDKSLVPYIYKDALGTHNGYLAAAKMYGILFLIPFLFVMLIKPLNILRKLFKTQEGYLKIHLFVVLAVLVGAVTEDYFVGINSIVTVFFFLSLAIIEMYSKKSYQRKYINT